MATKTFEFKKLDEHKFFLDVSGLSCPLPQLYTKKSLEKIEEGDTLEVVFDNPSSSETIRHMCDKQGHELLSNTDDGGKYVYIIEKG